MELLDGCRQKLRKILTIPQEYEIIFCSGGASSHYPLLPLNFLTAKQKAGFILSGHWSKRAYNLTQNKNQLMILASGENDNFRSIPKFQIPKNKLAYLYLCDNETIHGCEFPNFPKSPVPIITDITSNILSRKIDFSNLAVAFASAQKNFGVAGLSLIIIRQDFLELSKKKQNLMSPVF